MAKLPFWNHYPLDWLRDTSILSNEAKGVWSDILAYAWNEPDRGVYTRSREDFCRQLHLPPESYIPILSELKKVATVTASDVSVTLKCRRW